MAAASRARGAASRNRRACAAARAPRSATGTGKALWLRSANAPGSKSRGLGTHSTASSEESPTKDKLPHPQVSQSGIRDRSEEHTSELQSLMRISYAVFRLKKTNLS